MKIEFDLRGHIKAYQKITLSFEEFENIFVNDFLHSDTRKAIFEKYKVFLQDFKKEVLSEGFTHWINGSFVTRKNNPNDIDFVSLLDFEIHAAKLKEIDLHFRLAGAKAKYGVDAYSVPVFSKEHKSYDNTQSELAYWTHWFSSSKKNRNKQKFPKGFIEINF